ncbi:MAG TPA: hypothetical protein VK212_11075 [Lentimicrobium sp.]|nr:hypothetical protein [Lentimicrobium sp.]
MKYYIGIDDTDNLESRGTGFHARSLGKSLMDAGLLNLISITRHQLLADRRIPFTSHNSSACLVGYSESSPELIVLHCQKFLLRVSAFDSDAGLCVASEEILEKISIGQRDSAGNEIVAFGNRAKHEIVSLEEAQFLAQSNGIYLDGFLNTKLGMIGSLAAVGLRFEGNDGRLLWTPHLREIEGLYDKIKLMDFTGIERITDLDGNDIADGAIICIGEWCRPVMIKGFITLVTEKSDNLLYGYRPASKEYIKSISE